MKKGNQETANEGFLALTPPHDFRAWLERTESSPSGRSAHPAASDLSLGGPACLTEATVKDGY